MSMSGLVGYGSSDDDVDSGNDAAIAEAVELKTHTTPSISHDSDGSKVDDAANGITTTTGNGAERQAVDGPLLGPSMDPMQDDTMLEDDTNEKDIEPDSSLSPYSANRALLRELTLPPMPNLDIPPSPPGSPSSGPQTKFAHFLELKKKRVHFNEKIASSSALKNPSLLQKLLDFAEIDDEGQYATTLPHSLWNPCGFPDWTYKEELAKSQQAVLKKKEESKAKGQRDALDFVVASTDSERAENRTPGLRAGSTSTAERIMGGLEQSTPSLPKAGSKRKSRFET